MRSASLASPVMGTILTTRTPRSRFAGTLGGLIAFAVSVASIQAIRPTATYRTLELGGSSATVGLVAASFALIAVFLAIPIGRAVDRLDPRRFFLGGTLLIIAGGLLSALAPVVAVLAAGQLLVGLGWVSTALSYQTITANLSDVDRDRGFARLAVAASSGQLLGPVIAGALLSVDAPGIIALPGSVLAFTAAMCLAATGFGLAVRFVEPTAASVVGTVESSIERAPVRTIIRRDGVPQALLVSIAVVSALDLLIIYLPVLGEARGITPAAIGVLLSLRAAAALASRLTLPRMLALLGRRRLMIASVIAPGVAVVVVAFTDSLWLLAPMLAVFGYGLGIGTPLTMSWLSTQTPRHERGTALSLRMTGNRLSQVALPVGFGVLATAMGPAVVFLAMGMTLFASSGLMGERLDVPPSRERGR